MAKQSLKAVNIDLPEWMVCDLDLEAEQLGISRKALINVLLASALRSKKGNGSLAIDLGYLKAAEESLASEWGSKQDDEDFKNL